MHHEYMYMYILHGACVYAHSDHTKLKRLFHVPPLGQDMGILNLPIIMKYMTLSVNV